MVKPHYIKFSKSYTDVVFLSVDVDAVPDVAEKYEVSAMPTFKLLKYVGTGPVVVLAPPCDLLQRTRQAHPAAAVARL